jgi:hypothetical protein
MNDCNSHALACSQMQQYKAEWAIFARNSIIPVA